MCGVVQMIKKLFLMCVLIFITSCTFQVDDSVFTQEKMAHSAYLGTMYRTETQYNGAHNCDDTPSGCCASGYHMCTTPEILGGREVEDTGTGRNITIYNDYSDYDEMSGAYCSDYTGAGVGYRTVVKYANATDFYTTNLGGCTSYFAIWCCSDG